MTRASRDLSLTTNTPQGVHSTVVAGGTWELFDSTVPATFDFFIPDDAIVLNARLRVKLRPWLSFEKDVASGGGSTSGAGGASSPTSSAQAAHNHKFAHYTGSAAAPGVWSRYFARDGDGGTTFGFTVGLNPGTSMWTYDAAGSHDHTVTVPAHDHTTPAHAHTVTKGVFLETAFPGATSVALDGTTIDSLVGGPYTASASSDTFEAELAGTLVSPGWHSMTYSTAGTKGRVQPFVVLDLLQL